MRWGLFNFFFLNLGKEKSTARFLGFRQFKYEHNNIIVVFPRSAQANHYQLIFIIIYIYICFLFS